MIFRKQKHTEIKASEKLLDRVQWVAELSKKAMFSVRDFYNCISGRITILNDGYYTCVYCGVEIDGGEPDPPDVDDDESWAELAKVHADGCEWVATRAHRMEVE